MAGGDGFWLPLPGAAGALDDLSDVDTTSTAPSDGDVLTYDSGTGLWLPAAPTGDGGGGALTYLDEVELASSAASISFSSIAGTHRDLLIVGELRSDNSGLGDGADMQVGNGTVDAGSNYRFMTDQVDQSDSVAGSAAVEGQSQFGVGRIVGNTGDTGIFAPIEVEILKYADSSRRRHIMSRSFRLGDATNMIGHRMGGAWENAADAIDIVTFTPSNGSNFVAGSYLTIYGRG